MKSRVLRCLMTGPSIVSGIFKGKQVLCSQLQLIIPVAAVFVKLISFIVKGRPIIKKAALLRRVGYDQGFVMAGFFPQGGSWQRNGAVSVKRKVACPGVIDASVMNDFSQDKEGEQRGCRQAHQACHMHFYEEQDACHAFLLLSSW